jgi:hypothetical protein
LNGGASYVTGKCGRALTFGSPNDYVRLATNALPIGPAGPGSPMTGTLAFWIKTTATNIQVVTQNGGDRSGEFRVGLNEMETCLSGHNNAAERAVAFNALRVYGEGGGTLSAGTNLDLVSSSALDGGVTLSKSGWAGWDDASYMVDDNPAAFHTYQALYDWGSGYSPTGDTVTLTWGQTITFGAFGFAGNNQPAYFDTNMHFRVWGATNGVTFTNLLLDVNGGLSLDPTVHYWDLPAPFTGNALKFEIVSATAAMIDDFYAYEAPAPALPDGVVFAHRENVNLMNARDVEISATYAQTLPINLRGNGDNYGGDWSSDYFQPNTEVLTIDFKRVRNVKTVRIYTRNYGMPTVTLATSTNGSDWTIRNHSTSESQTGPGYTNTFSYVLDGAVDARWLRITGDSYQLSNYVGIARLCVYGDSGTLTAGPILDLVSSSALAGGVTLSASGWQGWSPDCTNIVDDNPATFDRYVLYDWTSPSGNTVTLTWGQTIKFGAFGFKSSQGDCWDTGMHFKLWGSTDGGATFPALLLDVTGVPLPPMVHYWDLPVPFTGNALKFEIVSATGKVNMNEFFAYEAAGGVVFANRANVNLLNARDVIITASHAAPCNAPVDLRGYHDSYNQSGAGWFGDYWYDGTKETFVFDFRQERNIKTIRTYSLWGGSLLAMTVETSNDGAAWTTQPNTPSGSGTTFTFSLNNAVNARYLRITGERYQYDGGVAPQVGSMYLAIGAVDAANNEWYFTMGLPAAAATNAWRDGNWHQVVFVWNTSTGLRATGRGRCYIDGVQQAGVGVGLNDIMSSHTFPSSWAYQGGAQIGGPYGSLYFTGSLDDYAIWDAQLSEAQVKALYNLANDSLNYNARNVQILFDVFHDRKPRATVDGETWYYASGLSGNPGDVLAHKAVILDGDGTGVETGRNHPPGTAIIIY